MTRWSRILKKRNPQESGQKLLGATVGIMSKKGRNYVTVTK
jgi:hypothetical protein